MSKKSPVKDRILSYLEHRGITENEFYRESQVSRRVLKHPTGISEDNLAKFIAYDARTSFGQRVSLDWLIRGEGDMLETFETPSIVNDPLGDYGKSTNEASIEKVAEHLSRMTDTFANSLKEVAKAAKNIKK